MTMTGMELNLVMTWQTFGGDNNAGSEDSRTKEPAIHL